MNDPYWEYIKHVYPPGGLQQDTEVHYLKVECHECGAVHTLAAVNGGEIRMRSVRPCPDCNAILILDKDLDATLKAGPPADRMKPRVQREYPPAPDVVPDVEIVPL